jgi:DNA-directed RNA polymerase subunit RPC12/RpoP
MSKMPIEMITCRECGMEMLISEDRSELIYKCPVCDKEVSIDIDWGT